MDRGGPQVPRVWADGFLLRALAAAAPGRRDPRLGRAGVQPAAVALYRLAREVVERHDGRLPDTVEALRRLPGVGPYTARAVAAIAGRPAAADTNVRRVLTRLIDGDTPRAARRPSRNWPTPCWRRNGPAIGTKR
ncbi:MAG: hypothetical protein U0531_08695 [Dehalococcoidia bacterium]